MPPGGKGGKMWLVTIIAALNLIFAFGFFMAGMGASSDRNPFAAVYFVAGFGFLTMVGVFVALDQVVIQLKKLKKDRSRSSRSKHQTRKGEGISMSFWQIVLSTALGAFFGFVAAIFLFFVKDGRQKKVHRTSIVENLRMELVYNINLYEGFEKNIQGCIEAISNDSRDFFLELNYETVATHFAIEFYKSGLLLKYFHSEDMRRWNVILTKVSEGNERFVMEYVENWVTGKDNDKETLYKVLRHEKSDICEAKEMSEYIKQKLPRAKKER